MNSEEQKRLEKLERGQELIAARIAEYDESFRAISQRVTQVVDSIDRLREIISGEGRVSTSMIDTLQSVINRVIDIDNRLSSIENVTKISDLPPHRGH